MHMKSYSFQTTRGNTATVYKVKGVAQNVTGMTGLTRTVSAYAVVNGVTVQCAASDVCTTRAAVQAAGF